MFIKTITAAVLSCALLGPAAAQDCSHLRDIEFYENNGYSIGTIRITSPFSFFFLVKQRLNTIAAGLPIRAGGPFVKNDYDRSFLIVKKAVEADSAFGEESPVKIVLTVGGVTNCHEGPGAGKTIDVVYQVFSTDPIPAIQATPDERQSVVGEAATTVAEQNTIPNFKFRPLIGYDHTTKGIGGGDLMVQIPGKIIDDFQFSGVGSSTTLRLDAELNSYLKPHRRLLDLAEVHAGYHYLQAPAQSLNLAEGSGHLRFAGASKAIQTSSALFSLRYGASFEQGLQQSNLPNATIANTITNSSYGAFRFYSGVAASTRYSDGAISYALEDGGAGLSNLSFIKQIGDVSYGIRFPSRSHAQWDVLMRATGGGIVGGPILLNERFFGGNVVTSFIPGDPWRIPEGPLVRSIPANSMVGNGLGGTSFYSANLTIGKVIKHSPMIPPEIENADGFASGIAAAENTAENFFADDYEADSQAFKDLTAQYTAKLTSDLGAIEVVLKTIPDPGSGNVALQKTIGEAQREARLSQNFINHLNDPDVRGSDKALKLRTLNDPNNSKFLKLVQAISKLQPLVPASLQPDLDAAKAALTNDLAHLQKDIDVIHNGPVRVAAEAQAKKDMVRPRETIDTLRFEANRFAVGVIGLFDVGRVWPDPYGTRYAIGGGVRLSLVNVNFNITYGVNPNPQQGQGNGALLFSLSYTNLFH